MNKLKTILTSIGLFGLSAFAYADDGTAEAASGGGNWSMLVMLGLAIAAFYFIILRPERKRRKAMEARLSSIKKGDRVTVSQGIRGTVHKVDGDSVILCLHDGAKMEVIKRSINEVQSAGNMDEVTAQAELVDNRS